MTAPLPARVVRCLAAAGLVLAAGCTSTAPGAPQDDTEARSQPSATQTPAAPLQDNRVCGFFSASSVLGYLDTSGPVDFDTTGSGLGPGVERGRQVADCVITAVDTGTARLSVRLAEFTQRRPAASADRQLTKRAAEAGCAAHTWPDLGRGVLCQGPTSTRVLVATSERLIDLDLTSEDGTGTPSEKQAVAFAAEADQAATERAATGR